jgi:uncharacterized protein (DUF1800 family)
MLDQDLDQGSLPEATHPELKVTHPSDESHAEDAERGDRQAWGLTGAVLSATGLAACNDGGDDQAVADAGQSRASAQAVGWLTGSTKPTATQAWRFLMQATMGPTPSDLALFKGTKALTYQAWLDRQLGMAPVITVVDLVQRYSSSEIDPATGLPKGYRVNLDNTATHFIEPVHFHDAWWTCALTAPDQLRQRIALALSEIFVVKLEDHALTAANYYSTLANGAFGTLYDLLRAVSSHRAMGIMLSHIGNMPMARFYGASDTNPGTYLETGFNPDQNFARELMQLFSIGLYELDASGQVIRDANGNPYQTYTSKDIQIIASIFTGWGTDRRGGSKAPQIGYEAWFVDPDDFNPQMKSMRAFPDYHEVFAGKPFLDMAGDRVVSKTANSVTVRLFNGRNVTNNLGKVIPFEVQLVDKDIVGNRDRLIATLLTHPNVGPFLAKQMIQRLVTSNPSAGQIKSAANEFIAQGFNFAKLIRAILLDSEAINVPSAAAGYYGKVKEPLLKMTHLLRAFKAVSYTGTYQAYSTETATIWWPSSRLGQGPMRSPSVFNFFRPGYTYPGTVSTVASRVAPEMQIYNESTAAGFIHAVQEVLEMGFGRRDGKRTIQSQPELRTANPVIALPNVTAPDPQLRVDQRGDMELDLREEFQKALADGQTGTTMVDSINAKLFGGGMSSGLRAHILGALRSVTPTAANRYNVAAARVRLAIYLAMVSPEFSVQK